MSNLPERLLQLQGAIVNVSSIAAVIPIPSVTSYCVAKAAQDALTRNLALKYAPQGVRCNAVLPGQADLHSRSHGLLHVPLYLGPLDIFSLAPRNTSLFQLTFMQAPSTRRPWKGTPLKMA